MSVGLHCLLSRRRLLVIGLAAAGTTARAQAAALDGRRFQGIFIERGKTSGDADTLSFVGGRFRSSACDRYGYSGATYRTTPQGEAIAFEAETESPKYGKLIWKGVVRGDKLDATATMVRSGKPPIEHWVVAVASK